MNSSILYLTFPYKGKVVNTMPQPIYSQGRLGTHCIGGWVGPRVDLVMCAKSRPHWNLIPGPSIL